MPPPVIRGTITRWGPTFGGSGTSANESRPYIAHYANGDRVPGMFTSAGAAKRPIEDANGGKFLNWVREERIDGIEAYTAYDP